MQNAAQWGVNKVKEIKCFEKEKKRRNLRQKGALGGRSSGLGE